MTDDATPKTLVAPLDGSEFAQRAVSVATTLATRFDADLILMTTPLTHDKEEMRDVAPAWLGNAAAASGYERTRTVLAHNGHGRIVTSALGSVATDVVHRITTPVVLLGPDCVDERG